MKKENMDLKDYIYELQMQTCKNNQYSRRENIEIANISEDVKQHQLENHILKILNNLGLIFDIVRYSGGP